MTKQIYKIKNLPKNFNLAGCKLGKQYIISGWSRGFWMSDNYENYKNGKNSQINPIFFKDFEEIKDWKVELPLSCIIEIETDKNSKPNIK